MTPFLDTVAADLLKKTGGNLSDIVVVFPNRRASLFLNSALTELSDRPLWSPHYMTISELFRQHSSLEIGDRIKLVVDLFHSYREVTGFNETLEQFYGWGELMLSDFDDIDKHMADASRIFAMLGDIHELDSVDFLLPHQKEIIRTFFKNFSEDHNSILKERFLQLWRKFREIYDNYRQRLLDQGLAYEGMLYRDAIENMSDEDSTFADDKTYVFVGFNLLNEVEYHLFSRLRKAGKAMFYWDYDHYYMKDHEAGKYIARWLADFPNELAEYDDSDTLYRNFTKDKDVTYLSAPTEDIQARYIMQWLTPERIKAGRRTAIVMCDESLLDTVINCLPEEVQHVNITTGYPLSQSPVSTLVRLVISLLQRTSTSLKTIGDVLSHPYMRYISDEAQSLRNRLIQESVYYPTMEELAVDDNMRILFSPLQDKNSVEELTERLMWVVKTVAIAVKEQDLTSEALYRMYTLLNRLLQLMKNAELHIEMSLYTKLMQQIIQSTTIPFHGEPLEGIQIMGVLETRNLDFDHVLVLSCNEGNMPAKVNDTSFIPHSIREAYGLTTVNNKVAIYSYYFHRLLQRASDIQLTYNSSTAGVGRSGEMSRFMLQLLAESPLQVQRLVMEASQETTTAEPKVVQKTDEMLDALLDKGRLSPSALGHYLRCPLIFFYKQICQLSDDPMHDPEDIDNRDFGNIFHKTMEILYRSYEGGTITAGIIDGLLKEKGHVTIKRYVDMAIREELFHLADSKRATPRLSGLQMINREMIIEYVRYTLQYDRRHVPFTLLGVEQWVSDEFQFNMDGAVKTIRLGGIIDRLDCRLGAGGIDSVRVLDYKTGNADAPAVNSVEDIFKPELVAGKHTPYILQTLLYSSIVAKKYAGSEITPAVFYVLRSRKEDYAPVIKINRHDVCDVREYLQEFREGLSQLLEDIFDKEKPFAPVENRKTCEGCVYRALCYS